MARRERLEDFDTSIGSSPVLRAKFNDGEIGGHDEASFIARSTRYHARIGTHGQFARLRRRPDQH